MVKAGPTVRGPKSCGARTRSDTARGVAAIWLAGASGMAIAAMLMFPSTQARACSGTLGLGTGVTVDCPSGTFRSFATSITPFEGPQIYSGNGSDVINMSGGLILGTSGALTPIGEVGFLDITTGTIETLGGVDTFNMNGGTVGDPGSPVSIFLGDGADTFTMTGGTVNGSVFGQGGGNTLTISGGTIDQSIFAGSENDTVTISGTANIVGSTADPDAIGLEAGDDTFLMTGGTVGAAVSGNEGADTLTVQGGSIAGFLFGNEGDDTIDVSGGTVSGVVGGDIGNDALTIRGTGSVFAVSGGDGNDTVTVAGTAVISDVVELEEGDDTFTMTGGTVNGSVFGQDGGDTITVSGGTIDQSIFAGSGNDTVTISGTANIVGSTADPDAIGLEAGDDTFLMTGGTVGAAVSGNEGSDTLIVQGGSIAGFLFGNEGDDIIDVSGGTVSGVVGGDIGNDALTIRGTGSVFAVSGGDGNDTVTVSGTAVISDLVELDEGDDTFTMTGGTVGSVIGPTVTPQPGVYLGGGADVFRMSGGTINGSVFGQGGGNNITVSGGTIEESIFAGSGNDTVTISGTANIVGSTADPDAIGLETGDDIFLMTGGSVGAAVSGNEGADTLTVQGGSIAGFLFGNEGDDVVEVSGGTVAGPVGGDIGDDSLTVRGTGRVSRITGGAGNDTVAVSGDARIDGVVELDEGNDSFAMDGGTVGGSVLGGAGADVVILEGGTILGGIDAETVRLFGGTVGGDITGLSGNTLVIDNAATLNLSDGVLFSGTDATGVISGTNLAVGSESQNFAGFSSLAVTGSTLRFAGGVQVIDALALTGGSTLFSTGAVTLASQAGGFGNLSIAGSTLNLIDGNPTSTLTLGGLFLDGATIGLDFNQVTAQADTIIANGAATATGDNVILVNLLGTPQILETTQIPILTAAGAPIGGAFTVSGISGTAAELFTYQVLPGAGGGLILIATPNAEVVGLVSNVDAAVNSQTVETMKDAFFDITGDAIEYGLGLDGGTTGAAAPIFGVFASGQFARVNHDGFTISNGATSIQGPSFDSDDFSAAISLDFNAARHFAFDQEYGLNLGLFAGYTSTDLALGSFGGFPSVGSGRNESGMAGTYGLFRKEQNYLLVSGMVLFGGTDVSNGVLNGASGEYDTIGYAVTASAGHIFNLTERARFDLRGGVLGISFTGDAYTDSLGVEHGESKVSFGAVKFDPGVYADYRMENGMIFSPYLRADLQQRFAYNNEASAGGVGFFFDDSDFSAALSGGFNLKISQSSTVSGEVRGKLSSDSSTIAGKIGLKVAF
ncbi:outer membrane autotransporter barrel domain protein [Mesorhizobium sp. L-8-3]|nr:outer membrane autotransporter barrel domain protein [Mesorhizobium sp. L-8-3]